MKNGIYKEYDDFRAYINDKEVGRLGYVVWEDSWYIHCGSQDRYICFPHNEAAKFLQTVVSSEYNVHLAIINQ